MCLIRDRDEQRKGAHFAFSVVYCPWSTSLLSCLRPWKLSLCPLLPCITKWTLRIMCPLSPFFFTVICDLPKSAHNQPERSLSFGFEAVGSDRPTESVMEPHHPKENGMGVAILKMIIGILKGSCEPQSSKEHFPTCVSWTWNIDCLKYGHFHGKLH